MMHTTITSIHLDSHLQATRQRKRKDVAENPIESHVEHPSLLCNLVGLTFFVSHYAIWASSASTPTLGGQLSLRSPTTCFLPLITIVILLLQLALLEIFL